MLRTVRRFSSGLGLASGSIQPRLTILEALLRAFVARTSTNSLLRGWQLALRRPRRLKARFRVSRALQVLAALVFGPIAVKAGS